MQKNVQAGLARRADLTREENALGEIRVAILALLMNGERRYWRLVLALPLSPLYAICFTYLPSLVGATCDVLLFGNVTGFAPETTLIRGGSARIALLYRLRRVFLLAVRAVTRGDVPLGKFWFGWGATRWTPSGYEGWTTGRRPPSVLPAGAPARERSGA